MKLEQTDSKQLIYLAHPIITSNKEVELWVKDFKTRMQLEKRLAQKYIVHDPTCLGLEDGKHDHEIVRRNKKFIAQSDIIVANLAHPSAGVSMEIGYAWLLRKHIIAFTGRAKVSAWTRVHSNVVTVSLDGVLAQLW